jgi:uncharacterized membrane protein
MRGERTGSGLKRALRRFPGDRRGGAAVFTALAGVALIGMGAFGVDMGTFYYQKRRLQTANDLAAIAAASDVAHAKSAALAALAANDYPASVLQGIEVGTYVADPSLSPAARFTPGASANANAARVSLKTTAPLLFGRVFALTAQAADGGDGNVTIASRAVAASSAYASFAIGSRLLSVKGGVLNALLGGLLGTSISLSAMDYRSLLSTQINLFSFSNALASRARLTAVTYDGLASSDVAVADVMGAMVDAARASGSDLTAVGALASIAGATADSTSTMRLNPLISYGPLGAMPVGSALAGQSVSALGLVSAVAQLANGTHQIALDLGAAVPGIASASLAMTVGERPVGMGYVTTGFPGASVHTAQTRLLLQVKLGGTGAVPAVNLPIYVEIASGTATLRSVSCGRPDVATSSVKLGVAPGVASAWIGSVSSAEMSDFTAEPDPGPATLVSLPPLATITGAAHAAISNLSEQPVTFSYADIQNVAMKTTSTTDYLSSLVASLLGSVQLKVNVIGLGIGLPGGLTGTVGTILANATGPVDQLLASVLGALGVGLGQADTWVSGVRCDGAVLVD